MTHSLLREESADLQQPALPAEPVSCIMYG